MKTSKTAKNINDISNMRQIHFKFCGMHNNKILVFEPARGSQDRYRSVKLSASKMNNDLAYHMYELMTSRGWNIVCRLNSIDSFVFVCDNWSKTAKSDFLELTNLKD